MRLCGAGSEGRWALFDLLTGLPSATRPSPGYTEAALRLLLVAVEATLRLVEVDQARNQQADPLLGVRRALPIVGDEAVHGEDRVYRPGRRGYRDPDLRATAAEVGGQRRTGRRQTAAIRLETQKLGCGPGG